MSEVLIRRATQADIPDLIQLRWDVYVEQGVADPADHDRYRDYAAAFRDFLVRWIDDVQCQTYVAVDPDTGAVVATGTLWLYPILPWPGGFHDRHGYVTNVYTIPAYRRRGIARRLMERLQAVASEQGATRLLLEMTPMSAPLYVSMGFVPSSLRELRLRTAS